MFTAFSVDTRRSDLAEQKRLHQEQLRMTLRRLRRRVRHAASVQRERALIYRLLAGRRFNPRVSLTIGGSSLGDLYLEGHRVVPPRY